MIQFGYQKIPETLECSGWCSRSNWNLKKKFSLWGRAKISVTAGKSLEAKNKTSIRLRNAWENGKCKKQRGRLHENAKFPFLFFLIFLSSPTSINACHAGCSCNKLNQHIFHLRDANTDYLGRDEASYHSFLPWYPRYVAANIFSEKRSYTNYTDTPNICQCADQ